MNFVEADNYCDCSSYKKICFTAVLFFTIAAAGCVSAGESRNAANQITYEISAEAIDINTASAVDLEKIPFIGRQLAARIVEHRTRHGLFRKPEHLMLIDGISDKRFRQIRHLIKAE